MRQAPTRIMIELSQGEPEPRGELAIVGEPRRSFAGWISLVTALENAVETAGRAGRATGDEAAATDDGSER